MNHKDHNPNHLKSHCPSCGTGHSWLKQSGAGTAIDPVCGMSVSIDSPIRHQYQGKTYYFCSEHCRKRFMANPQSFLEPVKHAEKIPAGEGDGASVWYTCPMHPEIRQI